MLQWSSLLFEAIFSLIILLHVKTSNFKGNDHQLKKLLIVKQIFLVSTIGNVETVWRIRILMLGCKGLSVIFLMTCTFSYGHLILVSFTSWCMRRIKSTLVIWHIAGKPYNWLNFIWSKTWRAIFNRFPGKTGSRITGSPDQVSKITGSRIKDQGSRINLKWKKMKLKWNKLIGMSDGSSTWLI